MKKILFALFLSLLLAVPSYAQWDSGGGSGTGLTITTVGGLPAANSLTTGTTYVVTDAADAADCTVGSGDGSYVNACVTDGTNWVIVGDGAGSGNAFSTHDAPAGTDPVASGADTLTWDDTAPIVITGNSTTDTITISVSAATTSATGVLEIATDAEAVAVTLTDKIVTPSSLDNVLAAPPAIGGTTPAAGDFTTLASSSTFTSTGLATASAGLTIATGQNLTVGTDVWNSGDLINAEKAADDADIGDLAISSGVWSIIADTIDEALIADNGIDSEHYNDGSIDADHLAADIIDETKIADNGIDSEHYNDGSIDAAHLDADIIDETKIADNGIDSEHYNDGSIDEDHLAAALAFDDGDQIDLSAVTYVNAATTNEGIAIPTYVAGSAPADNKPYLSYDATNNRIMVYESGGWADTSSGSGASEGSAYVTWQQDGGLSAEQVLTGGTGITVSLAGGDGGAATLAFDGAELDGDIFGDGTTGTWTFDGSAGTDATLDYGDGVITLSHLTVNNDIILDNAEVIDNDTDGSIIFTDGTNEIAILKTVASAAAEITISPAATGGNPVISTTGENDAGIVFQNAEGEEFLVLDSVGTDVNYLNVLSSATGTGADNQISLAPAGSDTNVGLIIDTKGTGTLTLGTSDTVFVLETNGFDVSSSAIDMSGAITMQGAINLGTGGVVISDDGDGAIKFLGASAGNDESLILNLDDGTANTATFSSDSSLDTIDWSAIAHTTTGDITGATITASTAMALGDDDNFNLGAGSPTTDWYFEYNSTNVGMLFSTADTAATNATTPMFKILVDSGAATMTADQDVFGIYKGSTKLFDVDEDGDVIIAGKLTVTGYTNDHYMDLVTNNATPTNAGTNSIYTVNNVIKFAEGGVEKDPIVDADSVTWSGTSHNFSAVTNFEIPNSNTATADAEGELAIDTDDDIFYIYVGGVATSFDFTADAANYVLKSDGNGGFTMQEDVTGGTTPWDTIGDPTADGAVVIDGAGETTTFTMSADNTEWLLDFTGAFTVAASPSLFKIVQQTGNAEAVTLVDIQASDSDVIVFAAGDNGGNEWQISQPGRLSNNGTADLNFTAETDLLVGGDQIDFNDLANAIKIETTVTTEQLRLNYDATNYATWTVGANGDLTVATVDDAAGTSGNLTFSPDGTIILTPATDVVGALTAESVTSDAAITATTSFVRGTADLDQTDLEKIDDITNGTQAANKAVIADANVNTGISKVTQLHIGASGSETQVTSTAAELNILDTVTATADELNYLDIAALGTGVASKAVVLDGSGNYTAPAGTWNLSGVTAITLRADEIETADIATDAVTMDAVDADGAFTSLTGAWATTGLLSGGVVTKVEATGTYTVGTTNSAECYGGIVYATVTGDITACDNLAAGMNFSVITIGDILIDVDVQADDLMNLDGTALNDGDKAVNTSTAGDIISCFYYDATGWYCISGGTDGDRWTDGG